MKRYEAIDRRINRIVAAEMDRMRSEVTEEQSRRDGEWERRMVEAAERECARRRAGGSV